MVPDLLPNLTISQFDPLSASAADFKALNSFVNLIRREGWPSESLTKWDELERSKRFLPSFAERHIWIARAGQQFVGLARVEFSLTEHNRHVANFLVEVHPKMRGRGIARELLHQVANIARNANRPLLISWTSSFVPAGDAFMQRIGGKVALQMWAYQLEMRDLNRQAISDWLGRSGSLESDLEFGFWAGEYPEADIDAIAEMHKVMNTMPRGNLDLEDETWTPAQLREQETALRQQGAERWTVYARCRANGKIAGYSEMFWSPTQPTLANQGDTGVFPEWRHRGLGTWLKAEMIERVLRDRPQVQRVRTWNAATNDPMIRINEQMGFRLQHQSDNWQVRLEVIERYLAGEEFSAVVRSRSRSLSKGLPKPVVLSRLRPMHPA
jgi:GNAT superfamily N-acetyltransferase